MARQEKSLAVCLEILQDYTAKDFSLFALLTTADFIRLILRIFAENKAVRFFFSVNFSVLGKKSNTEFSRH